MIKVLCSRISCFWGTKSSTKEEIVLTTEKQLEILKNAPREARCTSYYFVSVYDDDVLIEKFTSDYNIVSHLRDEREVVDIFSIPLPTRK